jgi:hypothetical protein
MSFVLLCIPENPLGFIRNPERQDYRLNAGNTCIKMPIPEVINRVLIEKTQDRGGANR